MHLRRKLLVLPLLASTVFLVVPHSASAAKACNKTLSSTAASFDAACSFVYAGGAIRLEGLMTAVGYDYGGSGCVLAPCRVPVGRLLVFIPEISFFVPCVAHQQGISACTGLERLVGGVPIGTTLTCRAEAENSADRNRSSFVGFRCASGKPNV